MATDRTILIALVSIAACIPTCTIGAVTQVEDRWSARQAAVAAAVNVSARQIDPALPDIAFLTWLQNVVGDDTQVGFGGFNPCNGVQSEAAPPSDLKTPWNLCVQLIASLKDSRSVSIALAASVVRDPERADGWKPHSARLASAYVVDGDAGRRPLDSLDVPSLRDLPEALTIPVSRWPHADLKLAQDDLQVEPAMFKPGDRVTVVVTVHNVGQESARVLVYVFGMPECSDVGFGLVNPPLSGTVPAGDALTWRADVIAPDLPRWWLHVSVRLLPVAQMIRKYEETNVMKGTGKPVGAGTFKKCSGFWPA